MTKQVTIVDTGLGNFASIANMIRKAGGEARISEDPRVILDAQRLILPGVGAFDPGMVQLRERGLIGVLNRKALEEKVPVLGICLGMQFLTRGSEEGTLPGLGWIDAETRRFVPSPPLRIPHMGWNTVTPREDAPLFRGGGPWRFYFVHSYHVCGVDSSQTLCTTAYGGEFVSGVVRGNIAGVQFHPEKSHDFGMKLVRNFLEWAG